MVVRVALTLGLMLLASCAPARTADRAPAAPEGPSAEPGATVTLAIQLGFPADALARLAGGDILTRDLQADSPTELALAAALYIAAPPDQVAGFLEAGRGLTTDPGTLLLGSINPETAAADLARARFEPGETAEAGRLLNADPQVNLSPEEARRMAALPRPASTADAASQGSGAIQGLLLDRFTAYRAGGPSAIAPYAQGQDVATRPGEPMLAATAAEFALWDDRAPVVNPGDAPASQQRFWWVKSRVESRPSFDLVHTVLTRLPDRAVFLERHFYALHSYNAEQNTLVLVPHGAGTLVFAAYRTWTDELTGIGGALRRAIAQGRFRGEITASLARLRQAAAEK